MKPHKSPPEEIVEALRKYRTGSRVYDLCREHKVSDSTFMVWKRKYYGMSAKQIQHQWDLLREIVTLRQEVKKLVRSHKGVQSLVARLGQDEKCEVAQELVSEYGCNETRACKMMGIKPGTMRSRKRVRNDSFLIGLLDKLVIQYPTIGAKQCHQRLRRSGYSLTFSRVLRVYEEMGLHMRASHRSRPARVRSAMFQAQGPNQVWSMDFMHGKLSNGESYRLLNIMDDFNRELLTIAVNTSFHASKVISVLERLKKQRSLPAMLRSDNGPEFTSSKLRAWCRTQRCTLTHIDPGKPAQNAYIESLNRSIRVDLLDTTAFHSLQEARVSTSSWRHDYNHNRPHRSLGEIPPVEFTDAVTTWKEQSPAAKRPPRKPALFKLRPSNHWTPDSLKRYTRAIRHFLG